MVKGSVRFCGLCVVLLSACAQVNVRSLATGNGAAAFDLTGSSYVQVDSEARRLCPSGFDTVRQWTSYHSSAMQYAGLKAMLDIAGTVAIQPQANQAQMTVVCKGGLTTRLVPLPATTSSTPVGENSGRMSN